VSRGPSSSIDLSREMIAGAHSCQLHFTRRYGADLTPDQKDALLDVIRARPHAQISPEIRREILTSVMRGEPRPEEGEGDVEMR
jgi:essential nuclear protein 1